MIAAGDWLTEMRAALAAERMAIRTRSSKQVEEATAAKEALLAAITDASTTEADRTKMLQGLALVREELKRNLVLLAFARDRVREAIERARPKGVLPGSRFSIQL